RLGLAVDQLLELLAWLEVRDLLRRHVHLVAGLGVAPLARLATPQPEAAEPAQLDLLAAMQRVDDALEDRVDDDLGVLLGEVRNPGTLFDELRFRHAASIHGGSFGESFQLSATGFPLIASGYRFLPPFSAGSWKPEAVFYCWCLK